jgi:hypothetical protein
MTATTRKQPARIEPLRKATPAILDEDVAKLVLDLLQESPMQVGRGADLIHLAELHGRAVAQIHQAAGHRED